MMSKKLAFTITAAILLLMLPFFGSYCQSQQKTVIKGTVSDANTGDPIPYVSVLLKGTTVGTLTDNNGKYSIETSVSAKEIQFSFLGYQTQIVPMKPGVSQTVNISLKLTDIALEEVNIRPGRRNYRNRGNPAVELIDSVIKHKSSNRAQSFDFLQYRKYEKIQFALSDITKGLENARMFEKYKFIFSNIDTTKRIGNDVLPIFIREEISDHYYRKSPEATKEILKAEKTINLNQYLDNRGVTANLDYLYQNINIYDNEILFLTNKFLSPIANTAPAFYRYYIQDTLNVKGITCIKLFFEPRNPADFLFHGNLYITLDSLFAVRKIDMGINQKINIDWIKDISVTQDFETFGSKDWLLSREEISLDAGIVKGTLGLYGQRTISYQDYKLNRPIADKVFKGPVKSDDIDPLSNIPGWWEANRQLPLSKNERRIYTTVDSLNRVAAFRNQMKVVMLITTGFLEMGDVELGPVGSFYSFNTVEGQRFRFGGRTTTTFSRKFTLGGYAAYGTRDRIFKYNASFIWSLTPRTIYQFPVKSIALSYTRDTQIPGQDLLFNQGDNFFLSFKRGVSDKLLLNSTFRIESFNEYKNHFSWLLGYSYTLQKPEGNISFNTSSETLLTGRSHDLGISEIYLDLRYAPNETFYQGKLYRDPFPSKYPVIQLKSAAGAKFLDNDFDYVRLQANISKRFWVSIIGYTDVSLEGGRIFGTVPYPLLFIHPANQTYAYQANSYNLMNFLEFVSDRYASLNIDHSFNGFLLNKVPLLKKLKFREVVTLKLLYGGLGNNNNPAMNQNLFRFPTDADGLPLTYTLGKTPYIEASVGLSNILRIFRVDVIKRFTYLNHPHVSEIGVRVQFKFDI
jgi:hypothetical protein